MTYTCPNCGREHDEWPALAFSSPKYYDELSQENKESLGNLDLDFCVITHPEQTDRFIRCMLTQKVNDHCEDLDYGLWVSLSEKSFTDYQENFHRDDYEMGYFGWLANDIPGYEFPKSVPMNVRTRTGGQRPEISPHTDFDHPFVRDYFAGISRDEAERRIQAMLDAVNKSVDPGTPDFLNSQFD